MTQDEFDDFANKVNNGIEGYNQHNFYVGSFLSGVDYFKTFERFILKPLDIIIVKNEKDDLYTIDWVGNDNPVIIPIDEFMSRLEIIKNNMIHVLTKQTLTH